MFAEFYLEYLGSYAFYNPYKTFTFMTGPVPMNACMTVALMNMAVIRVSTGQFEVTIMQQ